MIKIELEAFRDGIFNVEELMNSFNANGFKNINVTVTRTHSSFLSNEEIAILHDIVKNMLVNMELGKTIPHILRYNPFTLHEIKSKLGDMINIE